jgi:hypothetical protein
MLNMDLQLSNRVRDTRENASITAKSGISIPVNPHQRLCAPVRAQVSLRALSDPVGSEKARCRRTADVRSRGTGRPHGDARSVCNAHVCARLDKF